MKIAPFFAIGLLNCSTIPSTTDKPNWIIKLNESSCQTMGEPLVGDTIPGPSHVAKDSFCAKKLITDHAPQGVITIFGSARAVLGMDSYNMTREFSRQWTLKWGAKMPIMTGGGSGIMEAGNRGAFDAKGASLAISTYFGKSSEKPNPYATFSYRASSFSQRESDLVDYAAAIVVAAGGFGTEWEIFETLSKMQTGKKKTVPLVILGNEETWATLRARLDHLKTIGTINANDPKLVYFAKDAQNAVSYIESGLNL